MSHQEAVQLLAAGQQFQRMGQADKAIELLRRATALSPAFLKAHSTLTALLLANNRRSEATQQLTAALTINRGWAEGHGMLAAILAEMGQHESAAEQFRQAVRLRPDNVEAMNDLGTMLKSLNRYAESIDILRKAASARPTDPQIRFNLGSALHMDGQIADGFSELAKAVELQPANIQLRESLGNALTSVGRLPEAIETYREALAIDPANHQLHSHLLMSLLYTDDADANPAAFIEASAQFNQQHVLGLPRPAFTSRDKDPNRRLRIGYLSADLRQHSVSSFIEPLLAHHDPSQFEIFCYADVETPDVVSERLRKLSPRWRSVFAQSDAQIAQQIRRDEIDILIDLAGHSASNRLMVFGQKPAPLQVSYLGFPNTTGVSTIDCRITDDVADPPGESDGRHSEKLVRLQPPFLCFAPPIDAPDPAPSPMLSNGFITFGSFNNLPKLSPGTIELWSGAMHAVAKSRMLIKSIGLQHQQICDRLIALFESRGIDRSRLDFIGFEKTTASHLARYRQVDIALDSFPYNGTTTTCEALWMGVPVVTLSGRVHAARVGASLLTAIDRNEWIARNKERFAAIAAELAGDPIRLAEQRARLRDHIRTTPLIDGPGFARRFEASLRTMWRNVIENR